jgi:fused signal recognition particle receptor
MFSSFKKLKESLTKTRDGILGKISQLVTGRKIDDNLLDEIEEILLKADIGVAATDKLITKLRRQAAEEKVSDSNAIFDLLKKEMIDIFEQHSKVTKDDNRAKPHIWLITGVNGTGKTTTVGKLAHHFRNEGKQVMIAACDTFRAAAVEQLEIWAQRSGVNFIKAQSGADPASIAFDAATAAKSRNIDYLLIDTAGRLHTKANLMEELKKIKRVVEKVIPTNQIHSKLIIDGTTGQNAVSQVKVFSEAVGCDGIIMTKLDGTARGGIVLAIAEEIGVSVDFIGIGEGIEDIQPFVANDYVEALFES